MKKTEIAMIILIASISILTAYFIGSSIFDDIYMENEKVKTIDRVELSIDDPSEKIFNKDAINPAVRVQVVGTDSENNTQ
ncbi:MAG TPA: hypothetical protein PLO25_02660 [Candidatus Saccharibacteria bacterium]|nr:hypothetical protein [Candidatus Saccharibacteria bacterium]